MRVGMIAGSFDPLTNGHKWLIDRAARLVDKLIVVVGHNPSKRYMFTEQERVDMVRSTCSTVGGSTCDIQVIQSNRDMLINLAAVNKVDCLIRGIRDTADFQYESQMLMINRKVQSDIETLYLIPPRELTEVSSSAVKGLVGFNGWKPVVSQYVPDSVLVALEDKLNGHYS